MRETQIKRRPSLAVTSLLKQKERLDVTSTWINVYLRVEENDESVYNEVSGFLCSFRKETCRPCASRFEPRAESENDCVKRVPMRAWRVQDAWCFACQARILLNYEHV